MGSDQFTFESNVLPVVRSWAKKAFAGQTDRDDKVQDAQSIAWESLRLPRRCKAYQDRLLRNLESQSKRVFSQSSRSVTHWKRSQQSSEFSLEADCITPDGLNPARIASVRIDFREWFDGLSPTAKRVVELLGTGHTTQETAESIGCSPGNVSQYRRTLAIAGTPGRPLNRLRKRGRFFFA